MSFRYTGADKGEYTRLTIVGQLDEENLWSLHHDISGSAQLLLGGRILLDIRNRTSAIIEQTLMVNRGLNVKFFFDEAVVVK